MLWLFFLFNAPKGSVDLYIHVHIYYCHIFIHIWIYEYIFTRGLWIKGWCIKEKIKNENIIHNQCTKSTCWPTHAYIVIIRIFIFIYIDIYIYLHEGYYPKEQNTRFTICKCIYTRAHTSKYNTDLVSMCL
jgi:hypothetical protein